MNANDAGDQSPAGPVSPELLRISVSLPEALELFAEADTLQKGADLADRFSELREGTRPNEYLKSFGGDFVTAALQLPAGEHREAFRVWYEQRDGRKRDVERKLQRGALFTFGCPQHLANDPKWIPDRAYAAWCEIQGDKLAVAGGLVYFGVRVVTAAQWHEAAAARIRSPVPPLPEVVPSSHPEATDVATAAQTTKTLAAFIAAGQGKEAQALSIKQRVERQIRAWLVRLHEEQPREHPNLNVPTIRQRWIGDKLKASYGITLTMVRAIYDLDEYRYMHGEIGKPNRPK